MSAFIQPDGGINPVFRSYLVENNEGQLLTRADTLSQRKKKNSSLCLYLLCRTKLTSLQASGGVGIPQTSPAPVGSLLRATAAEVLAPPGATLPPHRGKQHWDHRNTTKPLILFATQWSVGPIAPASHRAIILYSVVPRTRPCDGLGTRGARSVRGTHLHTTTPTTGHLNTPAYVNRFCNGIEGRTEIAVAIAGQSHSRKNFRKLNYKMNGTNRKGLHRIKE